MKYRKKAIEVEAFQMTKERRWDNEDWPYWLHVAWQKSTGEPGALYCVDEHGLVGPGERLAITTLEGTHAVTFGDYIIQGNQGEIYPCKPDIFEATYDPVEETET